MDRNISLLDQHDVLLNILMMGIYFDRVISNDEINLSSPHDPSVLERYLGSLENLIESSLGLRGVSFQYIVSHYSLYQPRRREDWIV